MVKKFRNAIAHQNIQIHMFENGSVHIEVFNIFCNKECKNCVSEDCIKKGCKKANGGIEDFRISFTYQQLHVFAIWIADSYIKSIKGAEIDESINK